MNNTIPPYLLGSEPIAANLSGIKKARVTFVDKTLLNSARTLKSVYLQAENSSGESFIYKINPYVKFISLIYLAIMMSFITKLSGQLLATSVILCIYIVSGMKILSIYRRVLFIAFIFGFLVFSPASLNIITPGKIVLTLFTFKNPSHFLIYHIPLIIGFTDAGIQVVSLLFLRILNTISLTLLIVFTTPLPSFIKSFKIIGIPDTFIMIITLAYKYIFILSRSIEESYMALKSRLTGSIKNRNIHKLIGNRIFFIYKRSGIIYENTYLAMLSRGYSGEIKLHSGIHFTFTDFLSLVVAVMVGIILIMF
jgi:cobalt/nickel transport system permease protein